MRRAEKNADGEAVTRLEGACPQCGPISLTAGEWRRAGNDVAKTLPGEQDRIDWRIGNPLTFSDPLSEKYGSARFGHNEGFHGALVTRFGLLKEKAYYRDGREAERDLLQVFCVMHALAMEQRRRAAHGVVPTAPMSGAGNGGPAPPLPLARAAGNYGWAGIFGRVLLGYLNAHEAVFDRYDVIIPSPTYVGEGGRAFDHTGLVIERAAFEDDGTWPFETGVLQKSAATTPVASRRPTRSSAATAFQLNASSSRSDIGRRRAASVVAATPGVAVSPDGAASAERPVPTAEG
jgi:hypothetical protein